MGVIQHGMCTMASFSKYTYNGAVGMYTIPYHQKKLCTYTHHGMVQR